jgi:hypothetical protein
MDLAQYLLFYLGKLAYTLIKPILNYSTNKLQDTIVAKRASL